ncbi:MAG: type III-A CRISPR-associated protein Csm2 [Oscillospiraceae bacterium]|nr:type III-A CRISPR-associated protein Csm2 [Oscillospiraceae bacterium]
MEFADTLMQQQCKNITTSKLRKILSLFMDVYNTENLRTDEAIAQENVTRLQLAKIRLVYECGREKEVKAFAEEAYLFHWLKEAGTSREMVLRYIHYLEALVAYHRYHNEGEN